MGIKIPDKNTKYITSNEDILLLLLLLYEKTISLLS
jgi:hypothetical protein